MQRFGHTTPRVRQRARLRVLFVLAAVTLASLGATPAGAEGTTAPVSLRAIPAEESLLLRWGATSTVRFEGFRVRFRPLTPTGTWSKPIDLPATRRGYSIRGLSAQPYEIRVRTILVGGALGGAAMVTATPLEGTGGKEEEPEKEKEKEEKGKEETPGEGAVVGAAPVGPPAPLGGWHVGYADAFGAPLGSGPGQDHTFVPITAPDGCFCGASPGYSATVALASNAKIGPNGLELQCTHGSYELSGVKKNYACAGGTTDSAFEFNFAGVGEWAVELYAAWPSCHGDADPGWWVWTNPQEIDFFEGWCFGGPKSWAESNATMPDVTTCCDHGLVGVTGTLGFDPSKGYHRYTTVFTPTVGSTYLVTEYIDGLLRWSFTASLDSVTDGLILTNGMRDSNPGFTSGVQCYCVRSIAFYQDAAHAGQGIKGGGIAPGTTVK
jgi:hypothetical protein